MVFRKPVMSHEGPKSTTPARLGLGTLLLLMAGLGYVPGGILLIVASWKPTAGPYLIGQQYPYGGPLETWQVSAGFAFAAFGVVFAGLCYAQSRRGSRLLWALLLLGFVLMWVPHSWIGIAFLMEDPTAVNLGAWRGYIPFIIVWMSIAGAGFALSWSRGQDK